MPNGNRIDLLALEFETNLVGFKLMRNKTPHEVVAQILDYGTSFAAGPFTVKNQNLYDQITSKE